MNSCRSRSGGSTTVTIDLRHDGLPGAIAAYLVEVPEPALVDPGPAASLERLEEGLAEHGFRIRDLRHLLLTHVHLDHAGATGALVERNPGLTVHVHEDGAPHMADPEKLVASTRRTFGEAHDRLWGEVRPVPPERIAAWSPDERSRGRASGLDRMRIVPTPGHTPHHLGYLDESSGTFFAGDSMGIILGADAPTHPPTPPPGLDVGAWQETLERIVDIGPDRVAVTHFGVHGGVSTRARMLTDRLLALEERVRAAVAAGEEEDAERYEEEVRAELSAVLSREQVDRYFDTFGAATDWAGMRRFVEKNPL